ncbi:transposase family protein [Micromonospora sp. SL1-18]|uniref:transposase family protein n=1 Tax=Micromonospora sp. SL1-18 TaxID=3399128 RepID=UPI003A4DEA48
MSTVSWSRLRHGRGDRCGSMVDPVRVDCGSSAVLLPHLAGLMVTDVLDKGSTARVYAQTCSVTAVCPVCARPSRRVHSRYDRRLLDAALSGREMVLHLRVRRFFCKRHRWHQARWDRWDRRAACPTAAAYTACKYVSSWQIHICLPGGGCTSRCSPRFAHDESGIDGSPEVACAMAGG